MQVNYKNLSLETRSKYKQNRFITTFMKINGHPYFNQKYVEDEMVSSENTYDTLIEFQNNIGNYNKLRYGSVFWYQDISIRHVFLHKVQHHFRYSLSSEKYVYENYSYFYLLKRIEDWFVINEFGNTKSFISLDIGKQLNIMVLLLSKVPRTLGGQGIDPIVSYFMDILLKQFNNHKFARILNTPQQFFFGLNLEKKYHLEYQKIKLHCLFDISILARTKSYLFVLKCFYQFLTTKAITVINSVTGGEEDFDLYLFVKAKTTCNFLQPIKRNKDQGKINNNIILFNRQLANIIIYVYKLPEHFNNISKIEKIELISSMWKSYFIESWRNRFPKIPIPYGNEKLKFNHPVYPNDAKGKYFLQYATTGSGDQKLYCKEGIVERKTDKMLNSKLLYMPRDVCPTNRFGLPENVKYTKDLRIKCDNKSNFGCKSITDRYGNKQFVGKILETTNILHDGIVKKICSDDLCFN